MGIIRDLLAMREMSKKIQDQTDRIKDLQQELSTMRSKIGSLTRRIPKLLEVLNGPISSRLNQDAGTLGGAVENRMQALIDTASKARTSQGFCQGAFVLNEQTIAHRNRVVAQARGDIQYKSYPALGNRTLPEWGAWIEKELSDRQRIIDMVGTALEGTGDLATCFDQAWNFDTKVGVKFEEWRSRIGLACKTRVFNLNIPEYDFNIPNWALKAPGFAGEMNLRDILVGIVDMGIVAGVKKPFSDWFAKRMHVMCGGATLKFKLEEYYVSEEMKVRSLHLLILALQGRMMIRANEMRDLARGERGAISKESVREHLAYLKADVRLWVGLIMRQLVALVRPSKPPVNVIITGNPHTWGLGIDVQGEYCQIPSWLYLAHTQGLKVGPGIFRWSWQGTQYEEDFGHMQFHPGRLAEAKNFLQQMWENMVPLQIKGATIPPELKR